MHAHLLTGFKESALSPPVCSIWNSTQVLHLTWKTEKERARRQDDVQRVRERAHCARWALKLNWCRRMTKSSFFAILFVVLCVCVRISFSIWFLSMCVCWCLCAGIVVDNSRIYILCTPMIISMVTLWNRGITIYIIGNEVNVTFDYKYKKSICLQHLKP